MSKVLSPAHRQCHYGILHMHAVLGLVIHHRLSTIDHRVGYFNATLSREAMHVDGIFISQSHTPLVTNPAFVAVNRLNHLGLVGHGLAGMIDITLHVNDRHTGVFGYLTQVSVTVAPITMANGDTMPVGRENFADLLGRISMGDLHFVGFQENSMTTQARHSRLK